MRTCSILDCARPIHGDGYCQYHMRRFRRFGDPSGGPKRRAAIGEPLQWIKDHVAYDGDDCLTWPFGGRSDGYGTVLHPDGQMTASRAMCIEAHGKPLEGFESAHSCGNGHLGCTNQKHLRWDSHQGNHGDRVDHGTNLAGEFHNLAKLTEAEANMILEAKGIATTKELADKFGVCVETVQRIQRGALWRHLQAA